MKRLSVIIHISLSSILESNQTKHIEIEKAKVKACEIASFGNCVCTIYEHNTKCYVWINSIKMRKTHSISTCLDTEDSEYTIDFILELRVSKWARDWEREAGREDENGRWKKQKVYKSH